MLFEYSMALYSEGCLVKLGYSGCFKHLGLGQVGQMAFLEWNRCLQLLGASQRNLDRALLAFLSLSPLPPLWPFLFPCQLSRTADMGR